MVEFTGIDSTYVYGSIPVGADDPTSYAKMSKRVSNGLYVKLLCSAATKCSQPSQPWVKRLGWEYLGLEDTTSYASMSHRVYDGLYVRKRKPLQVNESMQSKKSVEGDIMPFTARLGLEETFDYASVSRRRKDRGVAGKPVSFEQLGVWRSLLIPVSNAMGATELGPISHLQQSRSSDTSNGTPRPPRAHEAPFALPQSRRGHLFGPRALLTVRPAHPPPASCACAAPALTGPPALDWGRWLGTLAALSRSKAPADQPTPTPRPTHTPQPQPQPQRGVLPLQCQFHMRSGVWVLWLGGSSE